MVKKMLLIGLSLTLNYCLSKSDMETFFDGFSQNYQELVDILVYHGPEWIDHKHGLLPNPLNTMLEIGCADGLIGRKILTYRPACRITGADLSTKMLEICAQKGGYHALVHADMNQKLPDSIMQQRYDLIVIMACLEYVDNYDSLFKQLNHVLNKQGRFFLTLQADDDQNNANIFTLHVCKEQEARDVLERNGFTIIDWEFVPTAYLDIATKKAVPYYYIIAQKFTDI